MNADDISALEDRRCDATAAGDIAALADLYADGMRYTHSHGGMDSKESMMSNIANGVFVYREIHRSDVVVTMFSGTAVVTGRARLELTAAGAERTVHCRYTNVWAEHDGRWQFVAWQSTPVPAS